MLYAGFDLLHASVGQSSCGRSGVVVGKSGIEDGEPLTVDASGRSVGSGKERSAGPKIYARVKKLFRREMQELGHVRCSPGAAQC